MQRENNFNWNYITDIGLPKDFGTYLFGTLDGEYYIEELYKEENFKYLDDYDCWIEIECP